MIAVVLAAGKGTRLAATSGDVPKPLMPVAGVPVIDRVLDTLAGDGLGKVVVVAGHRSEQVEQQLRGRPGVQIAHQDPPLGTGHALLAARDLLGDTPMLVVWSDVVVEPGTYRLVADAAAGVDGAVAVNHLDDLSPGGAVDVAAGRVTGITEKPGHIPGWNLTGVLALGPGIWPLVERLEPSPRGEYELPEAVSAWVVAGADVRAVPVGEPVFEVGTPAGLAAASAYWENRDR